VFIAFTAINIYSIFNSRVNEEKKALEKLREEYESQIRDLNNNHERFKAIANDFSVENSLRDIVDNKVPIVERTYAMRKLIGLIESKKRKINDSELKLSEINDLKNDLTKLKRIIRLRMDPQEFYHFSNANAHFKSSIIILSKLMYEEDIIS
jgi:hypothetical protein